jgi:hypothetical protein
MDAQPLIVMILAFVFLNCDIGAEKSILGDMRAISGVAEAMGVSGIYDIVASSEQTRTTG